MDALLSAFLSAMLAEWGDKTQLLVALFATRYGKPGAVLAGVALGALVNSLLAAAGGFLVGGLITVRAAALLVAVALVFAGVGGLITRKPPLIAERWKTGAFVTAAFCFFLVEFGDKTQFLTFAIGARFDSVALAALGATAGIVAANLPAVLLGHRISAALPLKAIRITGAVLFLLAGFFVAVSALRLV